MLYEHGGDIYTHPVDFDFSININPLGMPKSALRAAREGLFLADRYPDAQARELCLAIAKEKELAPEQILIGNGAAELIYALCHSLKIKSGLLLAPSFGEYEEALLSTGAKITFWNLREEENFRLGKDFLSALNGEPDILFLCNPNNPTGSLIEGEFLLQIAEKCERTGIFLCVDECFLPFLDEEESYSMLKVLDNFPHLLVLRAFTKIYGMPGLRLGYAVSSNRELLERMRGTIQPWNTSIPAQMAGIEAIRDREHLRRTRNLIAEERNYLLHEMSDGLADKIYPGAVNYIFFRSRKDLWERLLQEKILIRSCKNYRNLSEEYFRIGVRTHEENAELIRRWRNIEWQNQL